MLSMHLTIGLALALAGALAPRFVSRAKLRLSGKFLLDLVPSLLGFALVASLTARPILAGTIILSLMIVLWFLSTFPGPPPGATGPAIEYSLAGRLGHLLQYIFAPIGFNWQISVALVPGLAAREVAVGALGTVYALSASGDAVADQLSPLIQHTWSLPTACALLAWYVFAPQCVATLSVTRRETGGWRQPIIMASYLFAMAYVAAGLTFYGVRYFFGS